MKKLSETYKELGIAFSFPIKIKDANGNETYYEGRKGYWQRCECDAKDNVTYHEDSDGYWYKREYDANGNVTYFEDSDGFWYRREYDANDNMTYYEDSYGVKQGHPKSSKTCEGKVIEVDGIKYKLTAL
jgi:YD repeat-containing protein